MDYACKASGKFRQFVSVTPERSPVWLDYADKAVEHISPAGDKPERPRQLKTMISWDMKRFPKGLPEKLNIVCHLGAIEWVWSPMHSRLGSEVSIATRNDRLDAIEASFTIKKGSIND